ncbi:hypothetical protein MKZ38_007949 [Zalerion maritima]|uniref:Uncharacterized protein n=1 Tax=Zalerion maritima TaxID=339359 RepID=A0AAD5RUI9_9PEZI|nr:hypothetical protein MKZ38_007949 [Zalerion maritima]
MSASRVRGLTVWVPTSDPNQSEQLPLGNRRHTTVRTIVDRALFIVESRPGRVALRDLAIQIVLGRRNRGEPCLYPRNDPTFGDMDRFIDLFLNLMRSDAPEFYLTNTESEAMTRRYDWARPETTLNDFRPGNTGHMELNQKIITSMTDARSNGMYNKYMFQMIISAAHEFSHFVTGFLTGLARPITPPTVNVPGVPREAGYQWEVSALGGIVEFWSDPDNPNDINQPGIPYLFPDGRSESIGRAVSATYIKNLVAGGQALNIRVQPSSRSIPTTRGNLAAISNRMARLRVNASRAERRLARAGPGGPSTLERNRLQPGWVEYGYY